MRLKAIQSVFEHCLAVLTLLPQFEVQLELFPGFWSQSLWSLRNLFLADHHLINNNDNDDDKNDEWYSTSEEQRNF